MTEPDNDYLWDKSGPADPDVARLEKLLAPLRHDAPLDEVRLQRRRRLPWVWIVGAVAVAVAVVAAVAWSRWPDRGGSQQVVYACRPEASGFTFSAQGGSIACGGTSVTGGVLPVGGVLDTGAHEAVLAIADIGDARLGNQTRVRLDRTSPERHELYLERGRMHARVTAPPRLFAVGTPSASVTDLGCEYTLVIDERGAGSIHVMSGKVELAGTGTVVVVHAGTRAKLLPGRRASLPVIADATPQMIAAVDDYDRGVADALEHLLATATPADAITLAALVDRVPAAHKRTVLERLMELFPAPQAVTVDDALADPALWEMWHDEIVFQVDAAAYEKSK